MHKRSIIEALTATNNKQELSTMNTIKFNTGREYTEHGQRIVARLLDDGDIVFLDIDRGIDGVIRANGISKEDIEELYFNRVTIMDCYDNGNYNQGNAYASREVLADLQTIAQSI